MIDFRYHLVSLVAVFLALAVGIVVGSVVLDEPLVRAAARDDAALRDQRDHLHGQVSHLRGELEAERTFGREVASSLVAGRLDDESVLVVAAPGVDAAPRRDAEELVRQAGGSLTGTLALRGGYADPAQRPVMDELVARLVPAGVELPSGSAAERAAAELAAVLMTRGGQEGAGEPSADQAARASVLTGFAELDLLDGAGSVTAPASLALVLVPGGAGTPTGTDAVTSLVRALDSRGGGAVVAGPEGAASSPGVLAGVRASGAGGDQVSTVDTLGSTAGQVAVTYALAEQARGGVGHYGYGRGAGAVLPEPSTPGGPSEGRAAGHSAGRDVAAGGGD